MSWLTSFKIALIKEDSKKLSSLIDSLPQFETLQEMQEASLLINQAITFLQSIKDSTAAEMIANRKTKTYLES